MNNITLDTRELRLKPNLNIGEVSLPTRQEASHALKKTMALVGVVLANVTFQQTSKAAEVEIAWDRNATSANPTVHTTGYTVHWGTNPANLSNVLDAGNNITYNLTNLPDGALLHVAVTARNAAGEHGAPSIILPLQTPYLVPSIPTGLAIQSQTQGEVTINWTPKPNYITRIYVGTQLGQGIQRYDTLSSEGSINIAGLAKRTTTKYYFSITQIDPNTGLESALVYLPGLSAMGVIGTGPLLTRGTRSISLSNFSTTSVVVNPVGSFKTTISIDPLVKRPVLTISGPQGKKFTIQSGIDNKKWEDIFTSYMTATDYSFVDSRELVPTRFYRIKSGT